jgi:parallel beta-helix repeat protein
MLKRIGERKMRMKIQMSVMAMLLMLLMSTMPIMLNVKLVEASSSGPSLVVDDAQNKIYATIGAKLGSNFTDKATATNVGSEELTGLLLGVFAKEVDGTLVPEDGTGWWSLDGVIWYPAPPLEVSSYLDYQVEVITGPVGGVTLPVGASMAQYGKVRFNRDVNNQVEFLVVIFKDVNGDRKLSDGDIVVSTGDFPVKLDIWIWWTTEIEDQGLFYDTIQAAIDAASAGQTIYVYDGIYNEALYINKGITLKAASSPIISGAQMRATNYGNRQATIFVENSINVILENLDIEGQGLGIPAGTRSYAILYENSSGTVRNCIVSPNTIGDMYSAAVAFWDNSVVTIEKCLIKNFGRIGIYSNNATSTILDNEIIGQVYSLDNQVNYGIEIEDYTGPSVAEIVRNKIYNCNNTHPSPLWSSAAIIVDIWMYYNIGSMIPSAVSIENNEIYDNYEAIEITKGMLSHAHYNNIYNNPYGIFNWGANYDTDNATFDARFNWWGDASGPYHSTTNPSGLGGEIGDNVKYSPWLGALFATTPRTYHVNPTGTIQEAVSEASSGDTVIVHSGTYDEQVVIAKSLTLQGMGDTTIVKPSSADKLTTVLDGHWWGTTKQVAGIIVANVATGSSVIVKKMKIDGESVTTRPTGADFVTGIFYRETGGLIDSVNIIGITITDAGTAVRGYGIYLSAVANTVAVEIKGSTLTNYDKNGIDVHGNKLTINIHDNNITGRGPLPSGDEVQNGIVVMDGAKGTVNRNRISDHIYTPETWWGAGILFIDSSGSAANNIITNCQIGIIFQDSSGSAQGNIVNGGSAGLLGIWAQYTKAGTWTATFVSNIVTGVHDASGYENAATGVQSWAENALISMKIENNQLTGDRLTSADGIFIGDFPEYGPAGEITATISNNVVSGWQHGIRLVSSITSTTIKGNTIFNNLGNGIYIESAVNVSGIHINLNNIQGNDAYGILNGGTGVLDACFNWWGDPSGPYHETSWEYMGEPYGPHFGLGDNVSDYVLYDPWLEYSVPLPQPTIRVEPSNYQALRLNETFSVNITMNNLSIGWRTVGVQFRLQFNSTLLEVVSVTEGLFMRQAGETLFIYYIEYGDYFYGDNIVVGVALLPQEEEWTNWPSGTGTIATITFRVKYQPRGLDKPKLTCDLKLMDTLIMSDKGEQVSHYIQYGHYEILPIHIADVNFDRRINMDDLMIVVNAFGAYSGHPRWNSIADINLDGRVSMGDIIEVVTNFGKVY